MASPSSPSSPSSSIPSLEDLRNLPGRILSSTNNTLKNLRGNIPTASSAVDTEAAQQAGLDAASMTDGLGFAMDSSPVTVVTRKDNQVIIYRTFDEPESSVVSLVKIHYRFTVDWARNNIKKLIIGALAVSVAVIVGTIGVNSIIAYRQKRRRVRVVRAKDASKREVVVVTNVVTLEGSSLALSLDHDGFIVFVGVSNQQKADEVRDWGCSDIHPIIMDDTKTDAVEDLIDDVSSFLDQHNSTLLGSDLDPLSSSLIHQDDLSSSTANISLIDLEHRLKSVSEAEAKHPHHDKTDNPLYRLAAVIVNPHTNAVGAIEKIDLEQWRHSINTNVIGAVIASQKFLPVLRRTLALARPRRSPRLIFISSAITGSIGFPYQSAICASHHAIESIADSLRREIKPQGIDVVSLRLGITDRSFRREWSTKVNVGNLGLFQLMDPTRILRECFKPVSTTSALCDVVYDAITSTRPASSIRVGSGALSYAFVGWAAPRSVVDWSIKGKPVKIFTSSAVKVSSSASTTLPAREE